MPTRLSGGAFLVTLIGGIGVVNASASAAALTASGEFNFVNESSINPAGQGNLIGTIHGVQNTFNVYSGGTFDDVGLTTVNPTCVGAGGTSCSLLNNPQGPTGSTSTAVTGQLFDSSNNQIAVNGSLAPVVIRYTNSQTFPGEYTTAFTAAAFPGGTLPAGDHWVLTISNTATSPTSVTGNTPVLPSPTSLANVGGLTLSAGAQPTFTWTRPPTVPAGSVIEIQILDLTQKNGNPVSQQVFGNQNVGSANTTTSFSLSSTTLNPTNVSLNPNDFYSIGVEVLNTTNGQTERTNLWSAPFQTFASGSTVALPILTQSSGGTGLSYSFNTPVTQGQPINIDPLAAVGFIYQIGINDPNFASVELPDIGNSNPYDIYLWDASTSSFVFDTTLQPNTLLNFGSNGVSEFEVLGINPNLGLDPANSSDFVTTLTFTASGTFTGTMTPVTQDVPEPGTLAVLASGFVVLALLRRHPRHDTRQRLTPL